MKKAFVKVTAIVMLVAFALTAIVACGKNEEEHEKENEQIEQPAE